MSLYDIAYKRFQKNQEESKRKMFLDKEYFVQSSNNIYVQNREENVLKLLDQKNSSLRDI